jgi:ferredoxin-NADP reductase
LFFVFVVSRVHSQGQRNGKSSSTYSQQSRCKLSSQAGSVQQEQKTVFGYPSRLVGRKQVAEGTVAFQFERPRNFLFKAGQFVELALLGARPDASDGLIHTLSIASSPSAEEIVVTTRMRDTPFKRALSTLAIGAEVRIKGPMGSFTLHNNVSRPAVFLAGGIGIAPFLSMISSAALNKSHPPIYLFYANRYFEEAPFINTLQELENSTGNFRFVPTLTRVSRAPREWKGETGHISPEMLSRYVSAPQHSICYIAGPPTMILAARLALNEAGVDEDDIRTEEFAGY